MEIYDMNANRLKTEEQKIHWLENEIKDLEYVLSTGCIDRNLKLNQLQMYREFLALKKANKNGQIKQAFTEMFESNIKSAVNDSLNKIETACVTALEMFYE